MTAQTLALRLASLVALLFSSAAAVDTFAWTPSFCGPTSGCGAVRASDLGALLGNVLPPLGLSGFTFIFASTLVEQPPYGYLGRLAATLAGAVGLLLIAAQVLVLDAVCSICMGVDGAALVAGAAGVAGLAGVGDTRPRGAVLPWWALYLLAIGSPVAFHLSQPTALPDYVRSLGAPGRVSIVEFSDFACTHCRALQPVLKRVVDEEADVHFVRKSFPLSGALEPAAAYACATAQDRGEEMAERLFSTDDLSAVACLRIANELSLDMARFESCLRNPEVPRKIRADIDAIRGSGFQGLPTVWIGDQQLIGFDPAGGAAPYREALVRARQGPATWNATPWVVLVGAAALLVSIRRKPR